MVRKELSFHTVFFQRRKNYCYSPLLSLRSMPLFFQKQNDRSNFAWQNYFVGACLTLQAENIKYINPMFRIAAYYPFYNTFNGMQQFPKQTILYAFDVFTGPAFKTNIKEYIRFTLTPGIHYMYQLSDEYHLNYIGGGISAGIELPVARHWSILNNGTITLDYANSGTNKDIQNFDISYQYQASDTAKKAITEGLIFIKSEKNFLLLPKFKNLKQQFRKQIRFQILQTSINKLMCIKKTTCFYD